MVVSFLFVFIFTFLSRAWEGVRLVSSTMTVTCRFRISALRGVFES